MQISSQISRKLLDRLTQFHLPKSIRKANSNTLKEIKPGSSSCTYSSGYTLIEILVVVAMMGILAAIAAPSWVVFWNNQKLTVAQGQVHEILRQTQATAKLKALKQQASFRNQDGRVQWAIHSVNADSASLIWNSLESGIQLDGESTLQLSKGIYQIQFNHRGEVNGALGRVTLSIPSSPMTKRCVFVSTLLGAMRIGETHSTPNNGRFCY